VITLLGRGRSRRLLALLGVGVGVLAWVLFRNAGAPYTFAGTLPAMIHDFGGSARVVSIAVDGQGVSYVVIGRDKRVHERDYGLTETADPTRAGAENINRTITNSTLPLSSVDAQLARTPLSAFDSAVPAELFAKVGFAASDSSATFTEGAWFLQSASGPLQYEARYNGQGLHRT
jgi:hypothetical protein